MNHLTSRGYACARDLNLLIEFAKKATKARWPRSTYKKVGDVVVWTMSTPGFDPNIRLWFDGTNLVAYARFEPPLNVEFDIQPGLALYDRVANEILTWAENRGATGDAGCQANDTEGICDARIRNAPSDGGA